ncbi:hypothetical protein DSUL_150036 [Desulfovibrionales bacterium]
MLRRCCKDNGDIIFRPRDQARLAMHLNITVNELLEYYTELYEVDKFYL